MCSFYLLFAFLLFLSSPWHAVLFLLNSRRPATCLVFQWVSLSLNNGTIIRTVVYAKISPTAQQKCMITKHSSILEMKRNQSSPVHKDSNFKLMTLKTLAAGFGCWTGKTWKNRRGKEINEKNVLFPFLFGPSFLQCCSFLNLHSFALTHPIHFSLRRPSFPQHSQLKQWHW